MARLWSLLILALSGIVSSLPTSQVPLGFEIPTPYQSAVLARRIYHLSSLAVVSTTFPKTKSSFGWIPPPEHIEGVSVGLPEYYSPNCSSAFEKEDVGNPLLLALNVATYVRNAKAGSNVTLNLAWTPPTGNARPASQPRLSLMGHIEPISEDVSVKELGECFTKSHPDARWWLPGNVIHSAYFAKLVVDGIYWVGGFGDRAYIGWLDVKDWQNVTQEEWHNVRLPGELSS